MKKGSNWGTIAAFGALGITGYLLFQALRGQPAAAAGEGGFQLPSLFGGGSESVPAPAVGEGQEGKAPPLTFAPEEEARLGIMVPAVSESGDSWYQERDIGGVLGWSPAAYLQRWQGFVASRQGSINLTAPERYAFGFADTMELAERQAASIERVYELGGYYEDGVLQAPSDYPGSGAQWLARARETGLINDKSTSTSTPTSSTNTKSEQREVTARALGSTSFSERILAASREFA